MMRTRTVLVLAVAALLALVPSAAFAGYPHPGDQGCADGGRGETTSTAPCDQDEPGEETTITTTTASPCETTTRPCDQDEETTTTASPGHDDEEEETTTSTSRPEDTSTTGSTTTTLPPATTSAPTSTVGVVVVDEQPPPAEGDELPFTGASTVIPMLAGGIALIAAGAFALRYGRRRRPGTDQ
jgi:LPXTG-motif cell wall-anchored protein